MTLREIEDFWCATREAVLRERGRFRGGHGDETGVGHLDVTIEPLEEPLPFEAYRVRYRSFGGVPITCLLAKPAGLDAKVRLPAIVTAPGYGGREQAVTLSECQRGYLVLQVFPRGQGESAAALPLGDAQKLSWGIESPEGYYYRGAYVDVLCGIEYLSARCDVDANRLACMGTSQGGGISLAVAAIAERVWESPVRAVVAHLPFLCAMGRLAGEEGSAISGMLGAYVNLDSKRVLEYFDAAKLAAWITTPVLLSSGGRDEVCPADSIRSVYEALSGTKSLVHYPDLEHTSSIDFYRAGWQWLERYI